MTLRKREKNYGDTKKMSGRQGLEGRDGQVEYRGFRVVKLFYIMEDTWHYTLV